MRAPTHVTFGLLTTSASFALAGHSLHRDWPALGTAVLGSLLPDIDSPRSALGRLLPWAAAALERWRHRSLTHSLLALSGLGLLTLPLSPLRAGAYAGLLLGYASHLLIDSNTPSGIMLFWPLRRACVLPSQPRFRIEVGSLAERLLFVVLVTLLLLTLPVSRAGGVWKSIRYLTATQAGAYEDYLETTQQAVLDFRGRWVTTHAEVRARAFVLEADATHFLIVLEGRVQRYGPHGDILPLHTRLYSTGEPVRTDTLQIVARAWPWVLARLPQEAWVSGHLVADRAFVNHGDRATGRTVADFLGMPGDPATMAAGAAIAAGPIAPSGVSLNAATLETRSHRSPVRPGDAGSLSASTLAPSGPAATPTDAVSDQQLRALEEGTADQSSAADANTSGLALSLPGPTPAVGPDAISAATPSTTASALSSPTSSPPGAGLEIDLVYAPAAPLHRLEPVAAIVPARARTIGSRIARAQVALTALCIRRPPPHYLDIRAAQDELALLQTERQHLADRTVRFSGVLYLRHLPEGL